MPHNEAEKKVLLAKLGGVAHTMRYTKSLDLEKKNDSHSESRLILIYPVILNHAYFPLSMTAIRDYLGEKVAFIFAWRSAWLSRSLLAPILFGKL